MSEEKALYDVVGAFQSIEEDLIKSMQRTMKRHIGEEHKEGINWSQWQAEMLNGLAQYKEENADMLKGYYSTINDQIDETIRQAYATGESETEADILKAIKNGYKAEKVGAGTNAMQGSFFAVNSRKLNSLIKSTQDDFEKAEHSILRRTEDIYRQTIFKTQMHYNTGAKSLWQAVDMATKDFLAAGINSIEYKNGARINIASYAEMALRTANKRANLAGCGDKRTEYGLYEVIVSRHNAACPKCIPYQGKVYIDDIYQNPPDEVLKKSKHTRLSEAVSGGMFHPNCKNGVGTYYDGITEVPKPPTKEDIEEMNRVYNLTQRQRECERNIRKYRRLSMGSMDAENSAKYSAKADQWKAEYNKLIRENKDVLRKEPERLKLFGVGAIPKTPKTHTPITPTRNVVQFKKAGTIKEANEFITSNFGIAADYGNLNIDVVNRWNNALTRSFNQFPELIKNFGFVGTCQKRNERIKSYEHDKWLEHFKKAKIDDKAAEEMAKKQATSFLRRYVSIGKYELASSWSPSGEYSDFRGVCINSKNKVFKTLESANASLKINVGSKFHPLGCDTVESVLDHEIGHQLDSLLGVGKMPEIQKLFDSRTTDQITDELSKYAWKNGNHNRYSEMIAEAWSEYCNNPQPRPIAQKVGETIIKTYNKKFGGK